MKDIKVIVGPDAGRMGDDHRSLTPATLVVRNQDTNGRRLGIFTRDGKAVAGGPASARFQQLGFPNRWRENFPLQPGGAAECNRNSGTRGAGCQYQPHSGGRNFLMGKSSKIDRI